MVNPDTFKKLHPQEFHRRFLGKGVRPDGREGLMIDLLNLTLVTPNRIHRNCKRKCARSNGWNTVICGIKAEVAVPDTNHPTTGYLVPNVDFPPICGSQFKPTAPGEFTQSVSEMVYRVVKGNNILDLETLCIEGGKAVWVLYADIVFLNYEGNAVDAALLAFTAALKDTKLPVAVYSDVEGTVRADAADRSVSLDVKRVPFGATFGIFEQDGGAKMAMADPTDEEEAVLISSVTVVVDGESQELMGTFGAQVPIDLMDQCIGQAKKRATAIKKL
ncbi:hypothetical protein BCR33DRAFT_787068 [Rhizoclosmatium globosum]|uniref:Ribosomal RNA-processing protein 43 n=1 Tax=Rhizoclosmatium globosum TaxID=329046 RepID=A0A1Y2C2R2_9FUNG|nr:hypothetical protein BCR33DRAFT_787068 [Rhizoclosmatium globosum]|eukprot:ORY41332.1 hypothetical protein BCR33DRAFT_787068 [Rhizoclosmatium globosum]